MAWLRVTRVSVLRPGAYCMHPALLVLSRNVLTDDVICSVGCQVVLAPILVGMMTNKFFPKVVKTVLPVTPVVGVLSTCFLVASAVAQVSCA